MTLKSDRKLALLSFYANNLEIVLPLCRRVIVVPLSKPSFMTPATKKHCSSNSSFRFRITRETRRNASSVLNIELDI